MTEAAQSGSQSSNGQEIVHPPATLRVLIPSPLGDLGIEFISTAVSSLVVAPKAQERKNYLSLTEALRDSSQSDFLEEALGRFSEYLAGARRQLRVDWQLPEDDSIDDVSRRVFLEASKIPFGETVLYQKLAMSAGLGQSYRVVRSILMANPIPLLIPCHRVVPRKGGAGSWLGGTKKKQWLLKMESRSEQD